MRGVLAALAMIAFAAPAFAAKPIAVMVPGFFNSLADGSDKGPYFSHAVVSTVEQFGYDVRVVNNLLPFGTVEGNAGRLVQFLQAIKIEPGATEHGLILITHSAGGLYSLRAMNLDPSIPVSTLVTISTPFSGINFITKLTDIALIRKLSEWFHLESLTELTREGVKNILSRTVIPTNLRMIIAGGIQRPCFLINCHEARRLSWVLTISDKLNGEVSDGIVPYNSALGLNTERMNAPVQLDHWEQVIDHRAFTLVGVLNTDYIEQEQRRFYSALMEQINR